jgi:hypothetical protein
VSDKWGLLFLNFTSEFLKLQILPRGEAIDCGECVRNFDIGLGQSWRRKSGKSGPFLPGGKYNRCTT